MDTLEAPDLSGLAGVAGLLAGLAADGWTAEDGLLTVQLTAPIQDDPRPLVAALDRLAPALAAIEAVGTLPGGAVKVRWLTDGTTIVASHPEATPEEVFGLLADVELARDAWEGDGAAALALPMRWRVRSRVDLSRLVPSIEGTDLRICARVETVLAAFDGRPFWLPSPGCPAPSRQTVYVALDATGPAIHSGSITLTGPSPVPRSAVVPQSTTVGPRPPEWLFGLPSPGDLWDMDRGAPPNDGPWGPLTDRLASRAGLTALAWLATDADADGERLRLGFFGFKRVAVDLAPATTLDRDRAAAAMRLHRWATTDSSPDRLLAIRQVASFYDNSDLFEAADDVLQSAEVVYAGLRSEAVAEAVKSVREAQQQTSATVTGTIASTQALVKASTERTLAALVALGGVVIANATAKIGESVGRGLLLVVAGFLGLLAVSAFLFEGPALTQPLKYLEEELKSGNPLLTAAQRQSLLNQLGVTQTADRARAVRWTVVGLHVTIALAILIFGFPDRYR